MRLVEWHKSPAERHAYPSRWVQCGGTVVERLLNLVYPAEGQAPRLVNGVPAGVCSSCGEQYLRASVAEEIERLLSAPPARHEEVPVWDFAGGSAA